MFCVTSDAFAGGTYYLTEEQLNNLTKQINNLQKNNNDMIILLENQKSELEKQNKEFLTLEQNYLEKYLIIEKQQRNYQQLLKKYENKELIYKYGIVGAFVVGLLVGVFISK